MAHELLIATNPSGGKKKRRMSAKQRAAAMRNLKKARAALGGRRRRRTNPAVAVNASKKRRRRAAASAPRRRRRINPTLSLRSLSPRRLFSYAVPALVGGGGAVANDVLYNMALNFVPATFAPEIMASLRGGQLRHVGKAASALLLGTIAGLIAPRRIADQMATGALTVVGYNVVRDVANAVLPEDLKARLTLGMYLDPALGYAGAGWQAGADRGGLSEYLQRGNGNGAGAQFSTGDQFGTRDQFGRPRVMSVVNAGNGT